MSNEKHLKQENHKLNEDLRRLQQEKQAQEHQNKKALLEANAKLDFQTKRGDEYQQKYKSTLQYKNQEESVRQLDEKLRDKEDEVIRLMRLDHQKSQEIQSLAEETEELKNNNNRLSGDLDQIKEAALNAIVDKDTTIGELSQKLQEYENSENINKLKTLIIELQDHCRELEDKAQTNRIQFVTLLEGKEDEVNELHDKIATLKEKNDERFMRLQQQILEYEKHIEDLTAERDHQQNFEEKYYHTEQKLRKTEKRILEFEQKYIEERNEFIQSIQKLQIQNQTLKQESSDLKEARSKVIQFEKMTENIKNEWDQQKQKYQKNSVDNAKKISHIESEKKIISDNLKIKVQEIERLRGEIDQRTRNEEPALQKETSSPHKQKTSSEDQSGLIQKLRRQNKDLQESNQSLKRKVEEQTKQLQESRHKLLQARSSSQSSAETNKLRVQIQQLTSYLKKVENDMLMKKITHAEDQNFWSIKEKKYKQEIQTLNKKYKKENSELLERIDRMKRLVPKDKKTDYYQSGFK